MSFLNKPCHQLLIITSSFQNSFPKTHTWATPTFPRFLKPFFSNIFLSVPTKSFGSTKQGYKRRHDANHQATKTNG
jgi:hypothetical protein